MRSSSSPFSHKNIFALFVLTGFIVAFGLVASILSSSSAFCGEECNLAKPISNDRVQQGWGARARLFDQMVSVNDDWAHSCRVPDGTDMYCNPDLVDSYGNSKLKQTESASTPGKLFKTADYLTVYPPKMPKLPSTVEKHKEYNEVSNMGFERDTVTAHDGAVTIDTRIIPPEVSTIFGALRPGVKGFDTSGNYISFGDDGEPDRPIWQTYLYTADSKTIMELSGNQGFIYDVGFEVSARRWHLENQNDNNPQFDPTKLIYESTTIPCSSIQILGQAMENGPGGNCRKLVRFTLRADVNYIDVTPTAGSRYVYDIVPGKPVYVGVDRTIYDPGTGIQN